MHLLYSLYFLLFAFGSAQECGDKLEYSSKNLGFDQIYVVNLKRRPERKQAMEEKLSKVNIEAHFFEAVDWMQLTEEDYKNISLVPEFAVKNELRFGEIGCFLSHYKIWQEMLEKGHKRILIFEDDISFGENFNRDFPNFMGQADQFDWDFLYLSRFKVNEAAVEREVAPNIKIPSHSWNLNAYALTTEGAKKLIATNPLKNFIPADHLVPVMYNSYYDDDLLAVFPNRNLRAYTFDPPLAQNDVSPKTGYISDTHYSGDVSEIPHLYTTNATSNGTSNGTFTPFQNMPSVLMVLCINETTLENIPNLLKDLSSMHYPSKKIEFVVVSNVSLDEDTTHQINRLGNKFAKFHSLIDTQTELPILMNQALNLLYTSNASYYFFVSGRVRIPNVQTLKLWVLKGQSSKWSDSLVGSPLLKLQGTNITNVLGWGELNIHGWHQPFPSYHQFIEYRGKLGFYTGFCLTDVYFFKPSVFKQNRDAYTFEIEKYADPQLSFCAAVRHEYGQFVSDSYEAYGVLVK